MEWVDKGGYEEANLGDFLAGDGARFCLTYHPTCYRRGPFRLLIEVSQSWGCFDLEDQPTRWYHSLEIAKAEAQAIGKAIAP